MTINEIRRHNLELLIADYGTIRALAEKCNINDAYLSQVRNALTDSRNKTPRNIGNEIARKLETGTNKPAGWMDHPHPTPTTVGEPGPAQYLDPVRERLLSALDDLTTPQLADVLKEIERIARSNREIQSELSARKKSVA